MDLHCHPWSEETKELTRNKFLSMMNLGGFTEQDSRDPESTLRAEFTPMGCQIVKRMAKFLSCRPTVADVLRARNKRSTQDYRQYVQDLFEDAKIEGLVVDDGYTEVVTESVGFHPELGQLERVAFEDFETRCPVWIRRVSRVEPIFQDAVDNSPNFLRFVELFEGSLRSAVKEKRALAFKSVIAYRTGLDIQRPSLDDVKSDYAVLKKGPTRKGKSIRNWYVYEITRLAAELGISVHLHTGMGECDIIFKDCNPQKMSDFLNDPETWNTKIILVHAGYPFSQEAAFFANSLRNVYLDLSAITSFASVPGAIQRMVQIFDLAPPARVLYGSDGVILPEIHWAGAKMAREELQEALRVFVESGVYDEEEAHRIARLVLSENAKRICNLSN